MGVSYGIGYMNITPDTSQQGFIQIFVASTNVSTMIYQVAHTFTLLEILTVDLEHVTDDGSILLPKFGV